ncbi:VWA domain-containing protein [Helicobacter mustelae]|uniref:VWFA domain-containing protein n=1 Tax=Helicobacter mustelae (strain ATCC 43772 / CCUG 25715 / CIP 103759 / LMG 18044 / NCTC 12198 / R85-136P) TaxID=679897 RepID=D3UIY8_HELM1|nr:VWA domain-containing protein [Helicobacter mustelae]CBG40463.1 Putative hypothetical protein [Helicobacter mustelae 12198]SQH71963.1 Uncharacterised protein [Helicobacter mustelae]
MNNIDLNQDFIDKALKRLIVGVDCKDFQSMVITQPKKNRYFVADNGILNAKDKVGDVVFLGRILHGGIYENGAYISDDRAFSYEFSGDSLKVVSICTNQSFTIINYTNGMLNISLGKIPTKEIAIVLCTTKSMQYYVDVLKSIAPFIGKYLFKNNTHAKASVIGFSSLDSNHLGISYDTQSLEDSLNRIKTKDSDTRMLNLSLIKAMKDFTKDNHLKKEIYLITDASASDPHNEQKMLSITKNLNLNISKNSGGSDENNVKIHCFSIHKDLDFLKNLATITNGRYYHIQDDYSFKKTLLTQINDEVEIDMLEIDKQIRPSKAHKLPDPDNPPS